MGEEPDLEVANDAKKDEPEKAPAAVDDFYQNEPIDNKTSTHSVTFEEAERAAAKTHQTIQSSQIRSDPTGRALAQGPLSVVSKKYDLDGKGYLDENEKVMRQYDKNNDGTLDLREVYKIVEEVRKQQADLNEERKKILNLKKIIIGLVVFTLILTLAMLGVSFAAAILAKDTRVNPSTGSLESKGTHQGVSTIGSANAATVNAKRSATSGEGERKLHGRKRQPLPSFSPDSKKFHQKILRAVQRAARRRRRRRRLFGSWYGLPDDDAASSSADDDESCDDNDDDCTGEFSFEGIDLDELCDGNSDIDFDINEESFKRIRDSHFENHETSVVLQITDDSDVKDSTWFYQYIMDISESYLVNVDEEEAGIDHDAEEQVMLLFTQTRLHCGDNDLEELEDTYDINDSKCVQYQPFFIFEECDDGDCTVRTCNYGVGSSERLEENADAAVREL